MPTPLLCQCIAVTVTRLHIFWNTVMRNGVVAGCRPFPISLRQSSGENRS